MLPRSSFTIRTIARMLNFNSKLQFSPRSCLCQSWPSISYLLSVACYLEMSSAISGMPLKLLYREEVQIVTSEVTIFLPTFP